MERVGITRPRRAHCRAVLAGLFFLVLAIVVAPTRAATLGSETTWGGAASEVTGGAAAAADGSAYATGFTTSFDPFGQEQLFVIKSAADGTIAWQRTWEGPDQFENDEGTDVAVAADGAVYVTGSMLGNRGDVLLLKFTPDGSLLWQKRWDGGATERGEGVAVAPDGSVYVVGGTSSFGGSHLFLLRFAPDGTLVSQQIWGPASGDGLAVAPDGSVHVAGTAPRAGQTSGADVVLVKFDTAGAVVWQQAYSGSEIADARGGVALAPDGSAYVAGAIQATTPNVVVDALLVKFGADGTLVWDRGWGGKSGDVGGAVAALSDGGAVLLGDTNSFGAGSDDAFLLRVSPRGRGLDADTWGGAGIDHADDGVLAQDGAIVVGATTENRPPYAFQRTSSRTSRVHGSAAPATGALVAGVGTVFDAGGTLATPAGASPGPGGFDAAMLRIAP